MRARKVRNSQPDLALLLPFHKSWSSRDQLREALMVTLNALKVTMQGWTWKDGRLQGQIERHHRTFAFLAFDPHLPAVRLNDRPTDGESQAGASGMP